MRNLIKLRGTSMFGEGEIKMSDEFDSYNTLLKLDLLKDWCYLLDEEYDKKREEYRAENRALNNNN
jgi:hypothetical protein